MPDTTNANVENEIAQLLRGADGRSEFAPKRAANGPLALRSKPEHEFVNLAEQLAQSLVRAAEQNLIKAQEHLDDAKRQALELQKEMKRRSDELADMTGRLSRYGEHVLEAHKEFNAPPVAQEENHDA